MLQSVNVQRLETIKTRLKAHGVRFSVSDIAKKTGFDKGNISAMLNGSKVISDNFWTKFLDAYPQKGSSESKEDPYSQPLPLGDINITVADYIDLVNEKAKIAHEYASTMKKILENKVVTSLDSMTGSLGDLHTMISAGLQVVAETQAAVEGVPVEEVLDRINKVAAVVDSDKKKRGTGVNTQRKDAKSSKKKQRTYTKQIKVDQ